MKPEIIQRIDQLNNGDIPNNYKKTEFGVFPCDWITDKKLKDLGVFGKGKGIPGDKMTAEGSPCVGYGDIYMKYNHFHFENALSFVDEETAKDSQLIKKGTLLFTGTGETPDEIGKCVCYNGDEDIYAGGDIITFISKQVNPLFIAYQQYQSFSLKKKASFGQGHSVVHIQKDNLEKLNIAYPAAGKEQSRIVEILMKWDKAIELYQKQIELLKKQKKAFLSELFPRKGEIVPRHRFPGFSEPWEQRKLGDVVELVTDFVAAGSFADLRENVVYKDSPDYAQLIRTMDLKNGFTSSSPVYVDKQAFDFLYRVNLDKESIILPNIGNCGEVYFIKPKILPYAHNVLGPNAIMVRSKSSDNQFLSILFQGIDFQEKLKLIISPNGQTKFNKTELKQIQLVLPTEKAEQKKLGQLFGQLDEAITLYQRKRERIISQQKVLQQYLLNGFVRV